MLTIFVQEDFIRTISPIQQDYFKLRFDDMLSEAHSFAARYRVYKEEYDKLQFIEYMKGVFIFQGLGNIPNNPLLDDLIELYNTIYAPYGHMIMTIPINNVVEGAVTKQPLKSKKLLVDYMKSTNNFFVFLSKKGPEGPFSLV